MSDQVSQKDHFRGRGVLRHLADQQSREVAVDAGHGVVGGSAFFAFLDSLRETVVLLVSGLLISDAFSLLPEQKFMVSIGFFVGWACWQGCRGAYGAWAKLRRMHRIALEEKEEIESNRPQEREELVALYEAKGFSGPLLNNVVDVLMADQERLLRVMLQEEMGFRLEEQSHPLLQGLCASLGVFCSLLVFIPLLFGAPLLLVEILCAGIVGFAGMVSERLEGQKGIPAFVWNAMMASVTFVLVHTCLGVVAR